MKRDHIDFHDRSIPKAFLITFRCYGTWLHGDERGSVDRNRTNIYGEPPILANQALEKAEREQTNGQGFRLDTRCRAIVEDAIREVCLNKMYFLHAVNVRTNHVHVVSDNVGVAVEKMMTAFKAYSTRALRSAGLAGADEKVWSRHGSTKYLWSDEHLEAAVDYVVNGQGADLQEFDREAR